MSFWLDPLVQFGRDPVPRSLCRYPVQVNLGPVLGQSPQSQGWRWGGKTIEMVCVLLVFLMLHQEVIWIRQKRSRPGTKHRRSWSAFGEFAIGSRMLRAQPRSTQIRSLQPGSTEFAGIRPSVDRDWVAGRDV